MASNPYIRTTSPSQFDITFEGEQDGFYCFRVALSGHKAMQAHLFANDLMRWSTQVPKGRCLVGNGFGHSKHDPKVTLANPGGKDAFVLFERLIDVALFEMRFPVKGYSPTMMSA